MRILMLAQFYHPILGGIEQHVRTLSHELVLRGHEVAVATIQHTGQPAFEMDSGVRVYRLRSSVQRLPWLFSSQGRQYAPPVPDPQIVLELRGIIRKERPHIVHAHNWLVRSFLPLKAWSRARLVLTLHNYQMTCAKVDLMYHSAPCGGPGVLKCLVCSSDHYGPVRAVPTVLGNWLMHPAERRAVDMFLAVSQAVAYGNRLKRSRLPFRVVPNFIADDPCLSPQHSAPYLAQLPDEPYLLFVGALGRVKGVDVLLHAYKGLTHAPPLILIGYPTPDWSYQPGDEAQHICIFRDWPHAAVMAAWDRCMLALVPSLWHDPCPTVAMEAMSMGKPVIASCVGGLTDIVADGETGLLVPPADPEALRAAMQRLVDDADERARMGLLAQQRVVQFQAKAVVTRIEQTYDDVLHA